MSIMDWIDVKQMVQAKWTCGYCGMLVAGTMGYYRMDGLSENLTNVNFRRQPHQIDHAYPRILLCPTCNRPTFFQGDKQVPGSAFGRPVQHLPPDLDEIYTEARNCMTVGAYIPAILTARTILMHIAVEQGAKEGEQFVFYVDFFVKGGFVPPNAKAWLDHIRVKGNAATHKISLMTRDDAEKVLRFIEMILMFLYEYPKMA